MLYWFQAQAVRWQAIPAEVLSDQWRHRPHPVPGQTAPAPDEWGTISAWAWGISRIVDYFESNKAVDARRVGIQGHSRLGNPRFGPARATRASPWSFQLRRRKMGTALARRDYGETVDDMAQNFAWQFCGNFQKWVVRSGNSMPVDGAHGHRAERGRTGSLSTGEHYRRSGRKGEIPAEVAAGPVYRLVGKKDLGVTELPPLDTPIITGDLGWNYHTGGHMATAAEWKVFLDFADRQFKAVPGNSARQ